MIKRLETIELELCAAISLRSAGFTLQRFSGSLAPDNAGTEEGRDPVAAARVQPSSSIESFKKTDFVCAMPTKTSSGKDITVRFWKRRKLCGEPVEIFVVPTFPPVVASQSDGLKERLGCEKVSFSIDVEGGSR